MAALALTAVLAFGGSAAVAVYLRLQGNLDSADVDAYLGTDRPTRPVPDPDDPFAGKDLNLLVIGTDIRDGENATIAGAEDGMRSDSIFLVHLSGDRGWVEVVSIPRDSLVEIPSCTLADGTTTPPHHSRMINHAFTVGGGPDEDVTTASACLRRTVELDTGVRTDEHVVVDMAGVQDVIDLLGGVPMDLPEAMDSPEAGLHVAGGPQVFDGRTTLAFIRARKGTGNGLELGSDLARITRQQQLLGALVTMVQSRSLLRDAPTLLSVLDTASRSLSVSSGLADVTSLAGLARGMRNLEPGRLITTTVPVTEAPGNRNRVVWTADAAALWARIAADEPPADLVVPTPPVTASAG